MSDRFNSPERARRAGLVCHHDGGAASLSDPFAAMVGSPAVIARGESGEEKCRRLRFCAMDGIEGKLQAIGVRWPHQACFAPSTPIGSCP
jgi:hypothetical protein